MASLYKKVISGKPYWYLREMGWVRRQAEAGLRAVPGHRGRHRGAAGRPRGRGACPSGPGTWRSATWPRPGESCSELGVAAIIDEVTGARRADAGAPARARYLALAALNRLVAPCSKAGVRGLVEDHRGGPVHQDPGFRCWITAGSGTRCTRSRWRQLEEISRRIAVRIVEVSGVDCSSVALDMTNFATFIATGNGQAPVAQRGQGQAEAHGPAARRAGPGRDPGRRDPADLARLPRRPARTSPSSRS